MTYTTIVSDYWPIERVEYAQHLLAEGLSARQIGVRLGVSHRSVLAKLSRMGIPCGTPDMSWPEERLARLRELATHGLSASQIGAELGITKNAVLGKMHRERIAGQPKNPSMKLRNGRHRPQPHKIVLYDGWKPAKNAQQQARALARIKTAPQAVDLPVSVSGRLEGGLTIFDLVPDSCRYPCSGNGVDIIYCAATTLNGCSWCRRHFTVVFKPRVPRG